MMHWIWLGIVGLLSGICASLGIGGGFVLLLYLTAIASMPQKEAQLLNLLFFLPIAVLSLILHTKHHLVEWKAVWPSVVGGCLGVFGGVWLANILSDDWLSKLFAIFIFLLGLRELFSKKRKQASHSPPSADGS